MILNFYISTRIDKKKGKLDVVYLKLRPEPEHKRKGPAGSSFVLYVLSDDGCLFSKCSVFVTLVCKMLYYSECQWCSV